jgi:hypothetical protein
LHIIPETIELLALLNTKRINLSNIGLIWTPVAGYLLIASCICLAVSIIKPLKAWNDTGLVWSLNMGLLVSAVIGIVVGTLVPIGDLLGFLMAHLDVLVFGSSAVIDFDISSLDKGLNMGAIAYIFCLMLFIVTEVTVGIVNEFKK